MRRLTTPEHKFTLQIDPSVIGKIRITYAQNNAIILTKEGNDVSLDGNIAKVKLTQEETKKFTAGKEAEIQVRVLTLGNDALASDIISVDVKKVLDDEVMA